MSTYSSLLPAIRQKYRMAIDSGRRSGHGRVVLLFFDLCGKIWGGSPATVQIENGLESTDFGNVSTETDDMQHRSGNQQESRPEEEVIPRAPACPSPTSPTAQETSTSPQLTPVSSISHSTTPDSEEPGPSGPRAPLSNSTDSDVALLQKSKGKRPDKNKASDDGKHFTTPDSEEPGPSGPRATLSNSTDSDVALLQKSKGKRPDKNKASDDGKQDRAKMRKLLDDKLSNYKQNNLKKRLPSEAAAEDLELKRRIAKQMEDSDRAFEEHMSKMSSNMDKLVGAISMGFTMMQRMLQPPSPAAAGITPTVPRSHVHLYQPPGSAYAVPSSLSHRPVHAYMPSSGPPETTSDDIPPEATDEFDNAAYHF